MSESITHTAIVDDCARLTLQDPDACPPFKNALDRHLDVARLGGITRHGDKHNPRLLDVLRRRYRDGQLDDTDLGKLAFVIGWLSHRAADRQMKPIWRLEIAGEMATGSPTDCSVYHDAFLLREHYDMGAAPPYAVADIAEQVRSPSEIEKLFQGMWQRMLIGMHTFIPDDDHIEEWLDRLMSRHQRLTVDLRRYAKAFSNPDPEKVRHYIDDVNFYCPDDPLIALARQLREKKAEAPWSLKSLVSQSANGSRYGQALARGLRYIQAANAFFTFSIDIHSLHERLDIGKPECES